MVTLFSIGISHLVIECLDILVGIWGLLMMISIYIKWPRRIEIIESAFYLSATALLIITVLFEIASRAFALLVWAKINAFNNRLSYVLNIPSENYTRDPAFENMFFNFATKLNM